MCCNVNHFADAITADFYLTPFHEDTIPLDGMELIDYSYFLLQFPDRAVNQLTRMHKRGSMMLPLFIVQVPHPIAVRLSEAWHATVSTRVCVKFEYELKQVT